MIVFFDTSALVKRYVIEADSPVVLALWTNASTLAVSQILYAEMAATFARKRREVLQRPVRRELPPSALLDHAEQTFLSDWASLRRIAVDDDVNRRVHGLLARYPLRGADSIHLASALLLRDALGSDVTFACADGALVAAAKNEGLLTSP